MISFTFPCKILFKKKEVYDLHKTMYYTYILLIVLTLMLSSLDISLIKVDKN